MMGLMENQEQLNQECIDLLLDKQDYLDYIDADMEAFYAIKAEAVSVA